MRETAGIKISRNYCCFAKRSECPAMRRLLGAILVACHVALQCSGRTVQLVPQATARSTSDTAASTARGLGEPSVVLEADAADTLTSYLQQLSDKKPISGGPHYFSLIDNDDGITDPLGLPVRDIQVHNGLKDMWLAFQADDEPTPVVQQAQLHHQTLNTDSTIHATCGSTNVLAARVEPYVLQVKNVPVPCTYSLTTEVQSSTSVVCPNVPTNERVTTTTCYESINVNQGDTTTTVSCGKKEMMTISHETSGNPSLRSELTYISCAVIVEGGSPPYGDTASSTSTEPKPTLCPDVCGRSFVSPMSDLKRIVGGVDTKPGEYPWQALIMSQGFTDRVGMCGGSLINSRFVLSAAHCFKKREWEAVGKTGVLLGLHSTTEEPDERTQIIRAKRIIVHPSYSFLASHTEFVKNDISLVELSTEATFTDTVGTICLPPAGADYENEDAFVTGFGTTVGDIESPGKMAEVMQMAEVKVVPDWTCDIVYSTVGIDVTFDSQLCTKGVFQESCRGDSGGPVVVKDPVTGRFTQVAIVSFGLSCDDILAPSVNTKVSAYRDWIDSVVVSGSCPKPPGKGTEGEVQPITEEKTEETGGKSGKETDGDTENETDGETED